MQPVVSANAENRQRSFRSCTLVVNGKPCAMPKTQASTARRRPSQDRLLEQVRGSAGEAPEWQMAAHSVSVLSASATALVQLTRTGGRAIPTSKSEGRAASLSRFRTEASRLCDELDERVHKAKAALERAFAVALPDSCVMKASDTASGGPSQVPTADGSKRTRKRKELRKRRRAAPAAAGVEDAMEIAGEEPPPERPTSTPQQARAPSLTVDVQMPLGVSHAPETFVFGAVRPLAG